jgi:thioredoxin 1
MEISDRDFEEKVLSSEKPVLLEYWASWCPPCHAIKGVLKKLDGEDTGFRIVTVNVDRNLGYASKYDVKGVPCFMIFKQGELIHREVGAKSEKQIRVMLAEHL